MWLTLLVETPDSEIKLNTKKPLLPNLTLKLRCGDSLVQEIAGKPLSLREYMFHLHPVCKTGITDLYKKLREDKKNYYYSRADDPDVLARIKRKEVEIIRTLVDSEIKLIDIKLKPLAATQQRLGSAQTAITTSEKKRTEDRLKLEHEKERLKELLETLKSGELRNKFFWEIDFAEVFADGGFDVVIANPPYVRQEKIAPQNIPEEEITKELRQEYKAALVRSVTAQWGDEFKKDLKSDLYVYFYYLALSLLKPRGVFCFISSNSWLDVGFGAKLQAFLLRNIETKAIYDNHAKRTFAEADINTIIVVFKRPKEKVLTENLARFVAFKKPFEVVIDEDNLKAIASAREKLKTDDFRCVPLTQSELWNEGIAGEDTKQAEITGSEFIGNYAGNKWGGKYLRAPDIFFTILEKGKDKLVRLGDIAEVRFGIKTGANEFFYVEDVTDKKNDIYLMQKYRMTKDEIKAKGLSVCINGYRYPDGSRHEFLIEKEFLKPVIKNARESKNILLKRNDLKYKVIMCHKDKRELEKTKILDYIDWGEKQQYHKRPTCAGRQRWWDLGNWCPADCFWMESINDINRVYRNPSNTLLESDKFYGIIFKNRDLSKKYLLLLNSTLYCLFRELKGFTGMGEGVLKLPVYDVKNILILTPDKSSLIDSKKVLDREINSLFEECGIDPSKPIREQKPNPLPDRAELDNVIFDELGLTEEERKEVYWSVCELVKQRLEKARSLKKVG